MAIGVFFREMGVEYEESVVCIRNRTPTDVVKWMLVYAITSLLRF